MLCGQECAMTSSKLHYIERGQGSPLVLLHPIGLDHSFWSGLIERRAERHRVIAFDLPGHGRSPPVAGESTMAGYAAMIDGAFGELDIRQASVLGVSFGGMIAQELAIRHPDRVGRLVACACGARIPAEARDAIRARGKAALDGGMAAVVETTLQRWFTPGFMTDAAVTRVRERLLSDDPGQWNLSWHAIAGHDALDRLPSLRIPTMVLVGDSDLGTPVPAARAIADAVPGSRFVVAPGAPHMVQIECADRFAALVTDFLAT
jgi:3-oxoadipate enol-lactonase